MEKKYKIGVGIVVLILAILLVFNSTFKQNLAGQASAEKTIEIRASKSGFISDQNKIKSFELNVKEGSAIGGETKDYRHYEYFDLSAIPANAEIISATLSKYCADSSLKEIKIQVKRVTEEWNETQNYNLKNRFPFTAEGGVSSKFAYDLVFDVTELVKEMLIYQNYGFEFSKANSKYEEKRFYSRNAIVEKDRPKLTITYRVS